MKKIDKDLKLATFLREKEAIITFSYRGDVAEFRALQASLGIPPPIESVAQLMRMKRMDTALTLLGVAEELVKRVQP
jgi:hypothetical protein